MKTESIESIAYVTGIQCPLCKEKVWSRHRHDFRYCNCGYCAIDGGREYSRLVYGGSEWAIDNAECPSPESVRIRVLKKTIQVHRYYSINGEE